MKLLLQIFPPKEASITLNGNFLMNLDLLLKLQCKNSSAKNSPIVSTSMGPFKTTGILGPEIDLVAAADASAEITPYLLICGIYNNRLLVNNKNFKNG
ncbi:unnamed protein product [Rhizophagus irregularis]|nr:unnamed protein product [Rhizophagus irregularis]CAB5358232.1 unnamed protein product [Rhizophagus irregularis]